MRKFWDTYFESCGPAFQPLGPDHPRLFNPRFTTQRPYSQTPPPRPTHPTTYNVPNTTRRPTYTRPPTYKPTYRPTYKSGYGVPIAQPLGPEEWLKAKNL